MAQKNGKNGMREAEFIVDRFEGSKAVLVIDGQELVLPKRMLDKDVKEGDVLRAEFLTDEAATRRRENLARAILEEILQGE